MPWEVIAGLTIGVPLLAGVIALKYHTRNAENRRRRHAKQYAERAGWPYAYTQPQLAAEYYGIPPFSSGSRTRFDDVIYHTDGHYHGHSFEFSFGIGPSNREYRHYQHVVSLLLPAALPPMSLRPQYATDSLGIALGLPDIQFESDDFNAAWLVRGTSAAAAHDIIHPRTMSWLMESRNRGLTFGVSGRYVFLSISGQQQVERIPDVANRLVEFTRLIPAFVWDKAHGLP